MDSNYCTSKKSKVSRWKFPENGGINDEAVVRLLYEDKLDSTME